MTTAMVFVQVLVFVQSSWEFGWGVGMRRQGAHAEQSGLLTALPPLGRPPSACRKGKVRGPLCSGSRQQLDSAQPRLCLQAMPEYAPACRASAQHVL